MVKLLYLLAGISLKQSIDEFKALWQEHLQTYKDRRDTLKEYRPNPAIMAGSREEAQFFARLQQQQANAPEIARLNRKIKVLRWIPAIVCSGLTLGLIIVIAYIESQYPSESYK